MRRLAEHRITRIIHIFVLIAMAGQFSSFTAGQRPAGIRTAIELMDRKWLKAAALQSVLEQDPHQEGPRDRSKRFPY